MFNHNTSNKEAYIWRNPTHTVIVVIFKKISGYFDSQKITVILYKLHKFYEDGFELSNLCNLDHLSCVDSL